MKKLIIPLSLIAFLLQSCITTEQAEKMLKISDVEREKEVMAQKKEAAKKELGVASENKINNSNLELDMQQNNISNQQQKIAPAAIEDEPPVTTTPNTAKKSPTSLKANTSIEKKVRMALHHKQYNKVLTLTKNAKAEKLVYYRAIAYFVLGLNVNSYSIAKRKNFTDNAVVFFTRLQKDTVVSDEIRARALFWHAIAIETASFNSKIKRKALSIFAEMRTKYPNSSLVADSFFYSGIIHYQLEEFEKSQDFFNKLLYYNSKNDRLVYERISKKYLTPKEAYNLGIARLKKYKKFFSR